MVRYWTVVAVVLAATLGVYIRLPPVAEHIASTFMSNLSVIGHRAGCHDAPENTLEAIRYAKELGASAVEIDLTFTKDGVGVIMHDVTVGRVTAGPDTHVSDLTLQQLKYLNISINEQFNVKFGDVKIPTLEEALIESKRLNLKVILDVKGDASKTADTVVPLFEKYDLYQSVIVTSFNPLVIYQVRKRNLRIIGGFIYMDYILWQFVHRNEYNTITKMAAIAIDKATHWSMYTWIFPVTGSSFLMLHKDAISRTELQWWSANGIKIVTWTVNNKIQKDYFWRYLKLPYMTDCIKEEDTC